MRGVAAAASGPTVAGSALKSLVTGEVVESC
jgi:hypothetical protein